MPHETLTSQPKKHEYVVRDARICGIALDFKKRATNFFINGNFLDAKWGGWYNNNKICDVALDLKKRSTNFL